MVVKCVKNGMVDIFNGMIVVVVFNVVLIIKWVKGNNIINKIINGIEWLILIIIFKIWCVCWFFKILFLFVKKVKKLIGKLIIIESNVVIKFI